MHTTRTSKEISVCEVASILQLSSPCPGTYWSLEQWEEAVSCKPSSLWDFVIAVWIDWYRSVCKCAFKQGILQKLHMTVWFGYGLFSPRLKLKLGVHVGGGFCKRLMCSRETRFVLRRAGVATAILLLCSCVHACWPFPGALLPCDAICPAVTWQQAPLRCKCWILNLSVPE